MRGIVTAAILATVLASVALGLVLVLGAVRSRDAVDAYVLVLGGIGMLAVFRATRLAQGRPRPSALERALQATTEGPERPKELVRLEREVDLGVANSFYLHFRLRPLLREIATYRLASRRGEELDGAGPEVFPPEEWELLRPDRPEPRDHHAAGLPLPRLRALVDRLEKI